MPINAGRTWLNRFGPRAQQVPFQPNPALPFLIGAVFPGTGLSSSTISVSNPTSAGDTIVVGITTGSSTTVTSVTDTQGNIYRQVVSSGFNSSNNAAYIWISSSPPRTKALSKTDTIQINLSGANASGQYSFAVDCRNYNYVDQATGGVGTGSSASITSGSVNQVPEVAVSVLTSGTSGSFPTWKTFTQLITFNFFSIPFGSIAFAPLNQTGPVTVGASVNTNWGLALVTLQQAQQSIPAYAQPGQAWIKRFATANHQLQPFVSAPPDSGSLVGTPANPGQAWRRYFTTISRQVIFSSQTINPPAPPSPHGSSYVIPAQPGLTWSRRFNIPEHITRLGNQAVANPGPVTSAGTSYTTPIRPGQTWSRLFNRPVHITLPGNQVGLPPSITPAGTPFMQPANPGRTWSIRFGERIRLIGTQQTIAPPSPPTSSGSRIPSPIQPGQTWSRRFRRITQQYVYTQVTLPPGISYAQPVSPGRTWLIRFKPRVQLYLSQAANAMIPGVVSGVLVSAIAGSVNELETASANISVQALSGGAGSTGVTGVVSAVSVASTGTVTITKLSDVPNISVQAFAQLAGPFITATSNVSVAANPGSFTWNLFGPVTSVSVAAIPGSIAISSSATGAYSVAAVAGLVTLGVSSTAAANVQSPAGTTSWTKTGLVANINVVALAGQSGFLQISGPVSTATVTAIAGSIQIFATASGSVVVSAPIGLAGGSTINTQMFPSQFVGSVEPVTSGWSGIIQVLPPPEINS